MATGRRGFGAIRRLPSKHYQASYLGPDLARYVGPKTFQARIDAEGWLAQERRLVETDRWRPPNLRDASRTSRITLQAFAAEAIPRRRVRGESLRPRTVKLYEGLIDRVIGPQLGGKTLHELRRAEITKWYNDLPAGKATQRAHAYALLRSLFEQAIDEDVLTGPNPCAIRGAGVSRRRREIRPASLSELSALVNATQDDLKAAVLLAAWCALRFGEIFEMRRCDVDLEAGAIHVRRAVVRIDRLEIVGRPKSEAGLRAVAIPPHVQPALEHHLESHVGKGRNALLFTTVHGNYWTHGNFYKAAWIPARITAGRPDLRFHDLRHTSAVLAAQTGATLAELMARLGHSTSVAAMRYQHAAAGRDSEIAAALSRMAADGEHTVVPFARRDDRGA